MKKTLDIALIWFTCITAFSLPFFLYLGDFALAFFEAASALTDVGMTFLTEESSAYVFLYFYRAFVSLFGGFLFLITLPYLISTSDSFKFAIHENFPIKKAIYLYFLLFILGLILYLFSGESFYNSFVFSSLTVSTTGGVVIKNDAVRIAVFFMFMSAILPIFYAIFSIKNSGENNKNNYFNNLKFLLKSLLKRDQLRLFFIVFFFAIFVLLLNKIPLDSAVFYILSFISTTGFITEDFFENTNDAIFTLYILAILGGFIGSIGGGIKLFRFIVLLKLIQSELKRILHPRIITVIKLNNRPIPPEISEKVLTYFFLYTSGIFATSFLISIFDVPYRHAAAISISLFTGLGVLPDMFKTEIASNQFLQIFLSFVFLIARLKIFILFIIIQKLYEKIATLAGVHCWKKG